MLVYLLLFGVIAVAAVLLPHSNDNHTAHNPWLFGIGLMLVMVMGGRHEVGGDWVAYIRYLESMRGQPFQVLLTTNDPGYLLLNWLGANIGGGIYTVNTLSAIILVIGLMVFCKTQPKPFLALLAATPYLVLVVGMGYTRQGIALGLFMLGISAMYRSKVLEYVLWLMLAVMFHKSAAILLPLVLFAFTKHRGLFAVLMLLLGAALAMYLYPHADYFLVGYSSYQFYSSGVEIRLLMTLLPSLVLVFLWRRFELDSRMRAYWLVFATLPWVLMLLLFHYPEFSTGIDRLLLYWIPLQLMVLSHLPRLFLTEQVDERWIEIAVVLYCSAILLVWLFFSHHRSAWIPYQWITELKAW